MPTQVLRIYPANSQGYNWALPPIQGGIQYYMGGVLLPNQSVVTVLTVVEAEKMFKAIQKQVASLQKEVTKLKDTNTKLKAASKKKR
jgi:hypothetical protein